MKMYKLERSTGLVSAVEVVAVKDSFINVSNGAGIYMWRKKKSSRNEYFDDYYDAYSKGLDIANDKLVKARRELKRRDALCFQVLNQTKEQVDADES